MEIEKLDYCSRGIYFKKDKWKTQALFIHFELKAFLKSSNLFCMLCAPPWTLYSALIYSLHKFLLTRIILDFKSIHINQYQTCWDWKHLRKQLCFYARESRNKITWFYFLQKILQVGLFNWRFNISLHRNINKTLFYLLVSQLNSLVGVHARRFQPATSSLSPLCDFSAATNPLIIYLQLVVLQPHAHLRLMML